MTEFGRILVTGYGLTVFPGVADIVLSSRLLQGV
jgi:hypothetical protein